MLQSDGGTSGTTWSDLLGVTSPFTSTSTTVSTGITAGTTYQFRVKARNIYGYGTVSSTVSVKASDKPAQMDAVTTEIDSASGGVKVTWTAPSDNSEAIDSYLIEIANKAGTTWTADPSCDGSDSATIAALSCIIPMNTLTAAPYSYVLQDLIVVRASAHNVINWSTVSASNTAGALARTVPTQMAAPTRDSATTSSQIVVDWTSLTTDTDIGYSAITSYALLWDKGSSTWEYLTGHTSNSTDLTFNVSSGLTPGGTYQFMVSAKNIYGYGANSTVLSTTASGVPGQPAPVTTANSGTNVRITWAPPAINNNAITNYHI